MEAPVSFGKTDYVMMGLMIFVSMAIGVFFAMSGNGQRTQLDYLLGGRRMGVIPVCLSLFATFTSAIGLLGLPAEVYSYGTMIIYYSFSISLANAMSLFTLIPLIHPLGITSVYEYLERRYKSKAVRLLGSTLGILTNISYMTIALLSPALALQTAAGLPLWISLVLLGTIGTIYTTIGGIKGVVWTDAFQTIIIFGGILATVIKGSMDVGGISEVWRRADETGRLTLDEVMVISAILNVFYGIGMSLTGMTLVVYFDNIGCDPLAAGYISSSNQLVPYFVIHVLGAIPGLSGLYISTIFSGALSTLSSGINSLAANTMEDFLHPVVKNFPESKKTFFSKVLVSIYGVGIIGLAYLAKEAKGTVTQFAYMALGSTTGPVLGLFLLSGTFPQANQVGAVVGCLAGLAFSVWLNVCKSMYGVPYPSLPAVSVDSCLNNTAAVGMNGNASAIHEVYDPNTVYNHSLENVQLSDTSTEIEVIRPQDTSFSIFDISYVWVPPIGTLVCIFMGLVASLIFEFTSGSRTRPSSKYLFPFTRVLCSKTEQDQGDTEQGELQCILK